MQTKEDKAAEPVQQAKINAYFLIARAMNFYTLTGFPKCTVAEIAKRCPELSENGIATRLPEMKRRGYYISCEYRPGTRTKQWWLTAAVK